MQNIVKILEKKKVALIKYVLNVGFCAILDNG